MNQLIDFALADSPALVSFLLRTLLILIIVGLPVLIFWWFKKFINKDRYVFAQNDHLYCLDTVTGKIRVARGYIFQEVGQWDKVSKKNQPFKGDGLSRL